MISCLLQDTLSTNREYPLHHEHQMELFYKNELIGYIYFVNDWRGKWHGHLKEDKVNISWDRRKDVFIELCCGHHKLREELK